MITLRPHQPKAVDAIEDAFRAGIKRPLVSACVASGKSLMMAELSRREVWRGGRVVILAHVRELVEQNAEACRKLGLEVGINAEALGERTWRAPVISASIQSVFRHAHAFGPITLVPADECHLWPKDESGMFHTFLRGLNDPRAAGFTGTPFRMQGGSLVEGEGAPFERLVFEYGILDGIRDGYLVPAFSLGDGTDKIDVSKLRTSRVSGDFTPESSDAQMIALMDNHIAQMVHHGRERRAWLIFEASTKAAQAMTARMNEWGIPTGLVLGTTKAWERTQTIDAFRAGRLRALVNVSALTTGFDVPQVDMLVLRRATQSLVLYIQMVGRLLRTIGGNITSSVAAGKADGGVLDFGGNIERHGPLDFIRPKEVKSKLVQCEQCGKSNGAAARTCWHCDAPMLKLCPVCTGEVWKGVLDCPHCGFDMRAGPREESGRTNLAEVPSGAALIKSWGGNHQDRTNGWQAIRKCYAAPEGVIVDTTTERATLPVALESHGAQAKWLRIEGGEVVALLLPNGSQRGSALHIDRTGRAVAIPMPAAAELAA